MYNVVDEMQRWLKNFIVIYTRKIQEPSKKPTKTTNNDGRK